MVSVVFCCGGALPLPCQIDRILHLLTTPTVLLLVEPLREVQQRADVHGVGAPDVVPPKRQDGTAGRDLGGVEDEDVDDGAVLLEALPQLLGVGEVVHVAREPVELDLGVLLPEVRYGLLDQVLAAAEDDDALGPGLAEALGDGEADAHGAAGDEDGAAGLGELGAGGGDGWVRLSVDRLCKGDSCLEGGGRLQRGFGGGGGGDGCVHGECLGRGSCVSVLLRWKGLVVFPKVKNRMLMFSVW